MKQELRYLEQQKEKILVFAREIYNLWEITRTKLDEVYFYNFI
jgi:hypothetical protein